MSKQKQVDQEPKVTVELTREEALALRINTEGAHSGSAIEAAGLDRQRVYDGKDKLAAALSSAQEGGEEKTAVEAAWEDTGRSALDELFEAVDPRDGSMPDSFAAGMLASHAWAEVKRLRSAATLSDVQEGQGEGRSLATRNARGGLTTFGLFDSSLRWAMAWIEKCKEIPDEDDEYDDWIEYAAALDLLKEPPSQSKGGEG